MKRFVSLLLAFGLSLTLMTAFTSALASGDPVVLYTEKNTQEGWDEYERKIEEATGIEIEALAFPTNPDDRQAKATTILASGQHWAICQRHREQKRFLVGHVFLM